MLKIHRPVQSENDKREASPGSTLPLLAFGFSFYKGGISETRLQLRQSVRSVSKGH